MIYVIVIDEVNDSDDKNLKMYVKQIIDKTKSAFTCKSISKRLPITQWLPIYASADFVGDVMAGITVGLTLIPQSISFATLAGLPPQVIIIVHC